MERYTWKRRDILGFIFPGVAEVSDPCDLSINEVSAPGGGKVVVIEARDGPASMVRLELSPADFATALLSGLTITAAITIGRRP